jgi:hypothetical protein
MELSTSIMLLPSTPMQSRHSDPRVGYYSENYKIFSDAQQKVEEKNFIVRHRMEPKQEDIQRYLKGELVEPKEPLVFYVDPATPKQWRPYIIAGITIGMKHLKPPVLKMQLLEKSGRRMTATCVWKMCVAKLYVTSRQNNQFLMLREFTIQEAAKFYKLI